MGVDKLKLAEALSAFLIREAGQASSGRLKEAVPRDVANGPLVEARAIRRNRMDDDGAGWLAGCLRAVLKCLALCVRAARGHAVDALGLCDGGVGGHRSASRRDARLTQK